ncbi:MAG: thiamine pyrophosphate-dependent enzyme [Thermaerobacter sp.]|nr:thiamine pyrophosphate-dependent enzyme [Thermaerobacter sp.]
MRYVETDQLLQDFMRPKLPHIWCPGCAHGIITKAVLKAVRDLGLERQETVFVSGIGCASRSNVIMDFGTMHTTHGRALAFATGIKAARPDLNVIVVTGDGDAAAIGGNHLIHAARRNIDITLIVFQNGIYGMTGGQYGPTTRRGDITSTSPTGHLERPFDLASLVTGAGATFVGRSTAYHFDLTVHLVQKAIQNPGFSLLEVVSSCPTYAGRLNGREQGFDSLKWMERHAEFGSTATDEDHFPIGILHQGTAPEWTAVYHTLQVQAQEAALAEARTASTALPT